MESRDRHPPFGYPSGHSGQPRRKPRRSPPPSPGGFDTARTWRRHPSAVRSFQKRTTRGCRSRLYGGIHFQWERAGKTLGSVSAASCSAARTSARRAMRDAASLLSSPRPRRSSHAIPPGGGGRLSLARAESPEGTRVPLRSPARTRIRFVNTVSESLLVRNGFRPRRRVCLGDVDGDRLADDRSLDGGERALSQRRDWRSKR